jgi:hypothetical protein
MVVMKSGPAARVAMLQLERAGQFIFLAFELD